jgi:sugar O-acyltransferase (sialic acid O-acetyltransferase NeuD family)
MSARIFEVVLPQLGVNDANATLVEWTRPAGAPVHRGQIIATAETTKAAFDIEAEEDGYLYPLVEPGQSAPIRAVIALILSEPDEQAATRYRNEIHKPESAPPTPTGGPALTSGARKLVAEHNIDLALLPQDRIVRERDVRDVIKQAAPPQPPDPLPQAGRVAVYGASQGGLVIAGLLRAGGAYEPALFVDDNPALAGKEYGGIPVAPPDLARLKSVGIVGIATHIPNGSFRLALRDRARSAGLAMINAVHPAAFVAASVHFGVGNVIKAGAVLDIEVRMGDCCIIDNGVILPHHNQIGDACHIAPGACFGGDCRVGPGAVVGVGASVAPRLRIGCNAIIGAGAAVVRDVPDNAIVEGNPGRIVGQRR